jgi:hypothetical protein
VVARWAHNPKVVRSSRASATKEKAVSNRSSFFLLPKSEVFILQNIQLCLQSTSYTARFTIKYTLGLALILKKDFLLTIILVIKVGQSHFNPGH